jgi:hypothetical protein
MPIDRKTQEFHKFACAEQKILKSKETTRMVVSIRNIGEVP